MYVWCCCVQCRSQSGPVDQTSDQPAATRRVTPCIRQSSDPDRAKPLQRGVKGFHHRPLSSEYGQPSTVDYHPTTVTGYVPCHLTTPLLPDLNVVYYSADRDSSLRRAKQEQPHNGGRVSDKSSTAAAMSVRINLPLRQHVVHAPIVVGQTVTNNSSAYSQSLMRRSYRESANAPPDYANSSGSGFPRFVSLPPRQRRKRLDLFQNRYEVALAHSAQV